MRFAVRGSAGLELWKAFPEVAKDDSFTWYNLAQPRKFSVTHLKPSTTGQQLVFSEDGQMFAIMHAESVVVYTSGTNEEVAKLAESNVVYVRFSPQNLFLLTWKRWAKDQATALHGNVGIWELKSGTQSHSFVQKKLQGCVSFFFFFFPLASPQYSPVLQWTDDELLSGKMVSSELQFFVGQNWVLAVVQHRPLSNTSKATTREGTQASRHRRVFLRSRNFSANSCCLCSGEESRSTPLLN